MLGLNHRNRLWSESSMSEYSSFFSVIKICSITTIQCSYFIGTQFFSRHYTKFLNPGWLHNTIEHIQLHYFTLLLTQIIPLTSEPIPNSHGTSVDNSLWILNLCHSFQYILLLWITLDLLLIRLLEQIQVGFSLLWVGLNADT